MNAEQWFKKRNKKKHKNKKRNSFKGIDPFYSTFAWLKLRFEVLAAYGRTCMNCGNTSGQMNVDHIVPRSINPKIALEFFNMQVLCAKCNKGKCNRTHSFKPGEEHMNTQIGEIAKNSSKRAFDYWNKTRLNAPSFTPSDSQCRIYLCNNPSADLRGYCSEHSSPLRSGIAPGHKGSTPVILRKNSHSD